MEPTKHESTTKTQSSKGGVRERISLEVEIKKMVADLRQKRDEATEYSKKSEWGIENRGFHRGRANAFDRVAQELQSLLYAL